MVKKRKRYTAKTTGRMVIVFLLFGAIIVTLGYTLLNNLNQITDLKDELVKFEEEKKVLLEEEETLNADIRRLSDPLYISKYAREKYFYSKENEIILKFED